MIAALPRPVQRLAQSRTLLVAALNPLGASITFGQIMYLLALHYGAGDTAMALLYASLNLTGLLALVAPWLLAGGDTSAIQTRAWLVRAIASLGILALPLLAGAPAKVWALVALVYVMMAARTIGVLASAAVYKAIAPPRELAAFSAKVHTRWNAGVLVTTLLCYAVLNVEGVFASVEWAFMALMAFGVLFNFATAAAMAGLPATGTVTAASPLAILAGFAEAWRRPERREVLWLTLLQMPLGLAAAFQLNYLSHRLGMAAADIFLLTLGGVLAGVLVSRVLAVVAGAVSVRALWFGLHAVLALAALSWCAVELVPSASRAAACAVLWVVSAGALAASTAVYGSMLSERLPAEDTARFSAVYQLAGVAATLLGLGGLAAARWLCDGLPGAHPYTHAFALWALLSLGVCALSLRLGRGAAAVDLLAQLTPGNLSTIFRAHQLRTAERDAGPAETLEREELLAAGTPAGRDLVLQTLTSPDPWHRSAALRAVRAAPFAAAVAPVMAEAADPASTLRAEAATTLGFLGGREAVPLLVSLLADPDRWLAASAAKSLARLGAPLPPERVLAMLADAPGARERSELLIALALDGRGEELGRQLAAAMDAGESPHWQDTVALYAAQAWDGREAMRMVLAADDERSGAGLEEAAALLPPGLPVDDPAWAGRSPRQRAILLTLRALAAERQKAAGRAGGDRGG